MEKDEPYTSRCQAPAMRRRDVLGAIGTALALGSASLTAKTTTAQTSNASKKGTVLMHPKAFVYTELQNSVTFANVPWSQLNQQIAAEAGFLNKTWFSGVGNNSVGGLYSFDSIDAARHYCTVFFPAIARKFGVAQTTRIFDATVTREASLDMGSPHFGAGATQMPGAFVYTEVQVSVPFAKAPWQDRNPVLKQQKGLISKLWLSGLNTNTLGGVDAFDTVENALAFAIDDFPKTAAKMNAAFYTRVFDARATEEASRGLNSPYYT